MENQQALTNLLSGSLNSISSTDKQTKYFKNYEHIYKRISRMEEHTFDSFLDLLRRVKVVIICLDEDQDENSVFESINSLGKRLAGSDLIKNYLFTFKNYECDHNCEVELTNLYTRTFEYLFKDEEHVEEELEQFFRAYIALEKRWMVKNDPKVVYYEFKKLKGDINSIDKLKEIINDLAKWALIYQTVRIKNHPKINSNYIGFLRSSFARYSVLMMELLEHYSHINSNTLIIDYPLEFNKALKSLVGYDAARFLANYPEGEVSRFTPMVFNRLKSMEYNQSTDFGDRFLNHVANAEEGYRLPSRKVLYESILTNDLYNRKRQQLKRFLILLENINKNELLSYEKDLKRAQIEHIVPQNPEPSQWASISFEEREKYLHTLGNLTLTFDNQTLSNKSFTDKKQILLEKSRIKLNNDLLNFSDFNAKSIKIRATTLLDNFIREFLNTDIQNF